MDKKTGNSLTINLYIIFLSLILAMAAFNVFYNLNNMPIDSWDEARHGVSAYEMLKTHDFIENTFAYKNDYWNLKPPLSFWAISLGYGIAGFNPLGLRLFSAIAALLTILVTALYTRHRYGWMASLISALVLATTTQYILSHSARTGDADSLHVLFFTVAIVSTALVGSNIIWLYIAGFSFSLSFLTKSWHSINIPVIIFLYLLLGGFLKKIRIRQWALLSTTSSLPILLWGLFRYSRDGFDFIKTMVTFDLFARTSNTLEGHIGGPPYYLLTLQYSYTFWALILIGCFIIYLLEFTGSIEKVSGNSSLILTLWIIVPLIFYTIASTKITWYMLPIYPALAISIGGLSSRILLSAKSNIGLKLLIIASIMVSSYAYERTIINSITTLKPDLNQSTLQQLKSFKEYQGGNIYTMDINKDYPTCWRQCDLLAAELYGDLRPMDGGIEGFLADKGKSLIIVPNTDKYRELIKNRSLKIVVEDTLNLILHK